MKPAHLAAIAAAVASAVVTNARADEQARVELSYAPARDVEGCPSQRDLADAVAARLGYDPFLDRADARVVVTIERARQGIVGRLAIRGPHAGEREIASPSGDCRQVVDALAVAIAIGVDPASLTRPIQPLPALPAPEPAPAPPTAPAPRTEPALEAPPARRPPPRELRVSAGTRALLGELPAPSMAFHIGAGVRDGRFSAALEGSAAIPAAVRASGGTLGGGRIQASLYAASLAPCAHFGVALACVVGTMGVLHASGEGVPVGHTASSFYAAVAARAALELPARGPAFARIEGDLAFALTRVTLQLAHQDVWTVPGVAARGGVAVGWRF